MKIFVSHHHQEATALGKIKPYFAGYGVDMFLAHADIGVGAYDFDEIKNAINDCHVVLVIGNQMSKNSHFCNQEIGYALGRNKPIVTAVSDVDPWGFIQRQQGMRFHDIEKDLPEKLLPEIVRISPDDTEVGKKRQCLKNLGIDSFVVDQQKDRCMTLNSDNWNDFNYRTQFAINLEGIKGLLPEIKIGYAGQSTSRGTIDEIPRFFPFLPDRFYSFLDKEQYIEDADIDVYHAAYKDLAMLLNDVRINKEIFAKHKKEKAMRISLFRDREMPE